MDSSDLNLQTVLRTFALLLQEHSFQILHLHTHKVINNVVKITLRKNGENFESKMTRASL